jgi:hypothetical protein
MEEYNKLARYPGYWRVDGIGNDISFDNKGNQFTSVYFSRILETEISNPFRASAVDSKHKDDSEGDKFIPTRKISFPVQSIRNFQVGTVWSSTDSQPGKLVFRPKAIDSLLIDTNQVTFLKLSDSLPSDKFPFDTLLPRQQFMLGKNFGFMRDMRFAVIPVINHEKTKWLIIPASEIFRFYIGVSSKFIGASLSNQIKKYIDWEKSVFSEKEPHLYLRQRLSRIEAYVLLQALSNEKAKIALNRPFHYLSTSFKNNLLAANEDKQPMCIQASFPFSGQTTLTVSGKRMPLTDDHENWAIYGMSILKCTHPRSFDNAHIYLDAKATQPNDNKPGAPSDGNQSIFEADEDLVLSEMPPSAKYSVLGMTDLTNQFSAMDGLKCTYHKELSRGKGFIRIPLNIGKPLEYSELEPNYQEESDGIKGVNSEQLHHELKQRDIIDFLEMLVHLKQLLHAKNWSLSTRYLDSYSAHGQFVFTFFPSISGNYTWYKSKNSDENRSRFVVWAEIEVEKGKFIYLIEFESNPKDGARSTALIYLNNYQYLDDQLFSKFLKLTAIQNGWPSKNRANADNSKIKIKLIKDVLQFIHIKRINHLQSNTITNSDYSKQWANNILKNINDIFLA